RPANPFVDPHSPDGADANPEAAPHSLPGDLGTDDPAALRARLREVYDLLAPPAPAAPALGVAQPENTEPAAGSEAGAAEKRAQDGAAALAERLALRRRARSARIEPPPGFAAVDLHVHTRFSPDSTAEPEAMLRAAAQRGLAAIAVTDHNTLAGAERTRAVARQLQARGELPASFWVIEGEEI